MGSLLDARAFLAAHCGIPPEQIAHYVTVIEAPCGTLAALDSCDSAGNAQRMLAGALAVLTGEIPLAPWSEAVIVQRGDLRAALKGDLPDEVRARFLEAMGEDCDGD